MKRLLAPFLLLPPLAVVPAAFLIALAGNWSASSRFWLSEALFLAAIALPLAYIAQATYGLVCLYLLRRISVVNLWTCTLVGLLPFATINVLGYVPEVRVAVVLAVFGLAVALASCAVTRHYGSYPSEAVAGEA